MKRIVLLILLTLLLCTPLAADMHDVSISFGHQAGLPNPDGLDLSLGVNVGLSRHSEVSLWGEGQLTPGFMQDGALGLSFSYYFLGDRNTGTYVPGSAINMAINAGMMFTMHNPWNIFIPTTFYVSLTPVTLGSPVLGHRERFMEAGLSYNWAQNRFGFFFSFLRIDWYVRGSWRDFT